MNPELVALRDRLRAALTELQAIEVELAELLDPEPVPVGDDPEPEPQLEDAFR